MSGESASYQKGSGSMLPQEFKKKNENTETLFPVLLETKYQFPRQGWSSLKFSLNSKIFNENGQLVGGRGRAEFSVVYQSLRIYFL